MESILNPAPGRASGRHTGKVRPRAQAIQWGSGLATRKSSSSVDGAVPPGEPRPSAAPLVARRTGPAGRLTNAGDRSIRSMLERLPRSEGEPSQPAPRGGVRSRGCQVLKSRPKPVPRPSPGKRRTGDRSKRGPSSPSGSRSSSGPIEPRDSAPWAFDGWAMMGIALQIGLRIVGAMPPSHHTHGHQVW